MLAAAAVERLRRELAPAVGGVIARCPCSSWEIEIPLAAARNRARAQKRLPVDVRQQLLDAIYAGQPFRTALRDLDLTPNQVWGSARSLSWRCQTEISSSHTGSPRASRPRQEDGV
jgi:hypothetical protein